MQHYVIFVYTKHKRDVEDSQDTLEFVVYVYSLIYSRLTTYLHELTFELETVTKVA